MEHSMTATGYPRPSGGAPDFPALEREVLDFWAADDTFRAIICDLIYPFIFKFDWASCNGYVEGFSERIRHQSPRRSKTTRPIYA